MFPDRFPAEKPAYVMAGSGEVVTYGELTERSRRGARFLREQGAGHGDTVALLLENHPRFLELAWAAQRAGLRYTAISPRLTRDEVATSSRTPGRSCSSIRRRRSSRARRGQGPARRHRRPSISPGDQLDDEVEGVEFLYSSGTTGRPKAIRPSCPFADRHAARRSWRSFSSSTASAEDMVYLSPAPLYHSAPLRFNMVVQRLGGTCMVMERFDPLEALALIERHRVTHAQLVPTMFVRLLQLPDVRARFDLSSLRCVVHAAAPCPVEIKAQMIEWLGPILYEYYSVDRGHRLHARSPPRNGWRTTGSVGRALLGYAAHPRRRLQRAAGG